MLFLTRFCKVLLLISASVSSTLSEQVTWKLKTSPVKLLPKYTTVFGVPVLASASTTVQIPFFNKGIINLIFRDLNFNMWLQFLLPG